jgi:hypothetical protein
MMLQWRVVVGCWGAFLCTKLLFHQGGHILSIIILQRSLKEIKNIKRVAVELQDFLYYILDILS